MALEREPLGDLLREIRKRRGLDLAEAARIAGLGRSTLYQWEAGLRLPRGGPLERLLNALDAPERLRAELIAWADPRHAQIALAGRPLGAPVGLGQVLRAMRLRRGLTQAEAARASGVSQAAFARWEGGGDVPGADALHAAAFALGASPEEAVALSFAQGGAGEGAATPEEAVHASIAVRMEQQSLHEALQLGIEADAWRRSLRDPRWDVAVTSAMAKRAYRYLLDGRLAEAEATAAEAVRRARRPEARSEAVMALEVLERLARWRGAPLGPTIRLAEAWVESIPAGPTPEGGSKVWAAKVAARARAAAGDLAGAMEIAAKIPDWLAREIDGEPFEFQVDRELAHILVIGHAAPRALERIRPDATGLRWRILSANVLLANGVPVPDAWLGELRAAAPNTSPENQRWIAGTERDANAEKEPSIPRYFL